MSDDPRYKTSHWQTIRLAVLDRDGWRCRARHDGCRYKARGSLRTAGPRGAHVHHIIDPIEGGDFWDMANLVAACSEFNIGERNRRQNRRARAALRTGRQPAEAVQPSRSW